MAATTTTTCVGMNGMVYNGSAFVSTNAMMLQQRGGASTS